MRADKFAGLALAAAIVGCSPQQPEVDGNEVAATTPSEAASPANSIASPARPEFPGLAIDGEGLRLFNRETGAARPLPFGMPREDVMAMLAFRGVPAGTGRLEECGAGPLDQASWNDGLTLYFQDSKFAGWAMDGAADITTASGIGIGSSRADLEGVYATEVFSSTLGTEFAAGNLFGLFAGPGKQAKITHLWAGASCNMR